MSDMIRWEELIEIIPSKKEGFNLFETEEYFVLNVPDNDYVERIIVKGMFFDEVNNVWMIPKSKAAFIEIVAELGEFFMTPEEIRQQQ